MDLTQELLLSLPEERKKLVINLFSTLHFTESQKLEIVKNEADLVQWDEKSLLSSFNLAPLIEKKDKRGGEIFLNELRKYMSSLRLNGPDYSSFFPRIEQNNKKIILEDGVIGLGKCPCPVDGEKTRCCKLTTLDAIEGCAFSCAYCSVSSFYGGKEIRVKSSLSSFLSSYSPDENIWHIGTGQASDSLILGDEYGTLSSLKTFAERNPNVVIELKSKAARRDIFASKWPKNMIFTWSLNAEIITKKEEHFTSSLKERIECAKRARDNGNLVGFHIHPMIYFSSWKEGYKEVVSLIEENFKPEEIILISMGTLTFTKAVLKKLRIEGKLSKVTEMELESAAGKFSYSLKKKKELFSTLYSYFSDEYKENIFFYLCMEDPSLWKECLNREYSSDKEFELDMKKEYFKKISLL